MALEFLKWWRWNLGLNHPFHFRCNANFEGSYVRPELEDGLPVQEHILVTLFDLAQHLDINGNVAQMILDVRPMLALSNLETLRIRTDSNLSCPPLPLRDEHTIRKLHMGGYTLLGLFKKLDIWWSSLTHVVLDVAYLSSGGWFRSYPCLRQPPIWILQHTYL